MEPELRFAVLGPVRAWRGDTELDLGAPQQRAVLAVLLLAEGPPGVRWRAWWTRCGGKSRRRPPRARWRTYVSRLRHCLKGQCLKACEPGGLNEMVESVGDGYALPLRSAALDLNEFLIRTKQAQAAKYEGDARQAVVLLRDALGLWQGCRWPGCRGSMPNPSASGSPGSSWPRSRNGSPWTSSWAGTSGRRPNCRPCSPAIPCRNGLRSC